MQKIEDKMAADADSIHDKDEALAKAKDEKKALEDKVKDLEKERDDLKDKVKDLEEEPGGSTSTAVEDTKATDYDPIAVANALKQFV